jgi:hypothetical protein
MKLGSILSAPVLDVTGIALIEFLMGVPIFRMELPKFAAIFAALFAAPVSDLLTLLIVELAALPIEFTAFVVALLIEFMADAVAVPSDFILLFMGLPIDPMLGDFGAEFIPLINTRLEN